jgi:hypothetical protein
MHEFAYFSAGLFTGFLGTILTICWIYLKGDE